MYTGFPSGSVVKNLPANSGSISGLGRSPGEGHGNALQYSCLEKSHGQSSPTGYTVHWAAKSWAQLRDLNTTHVYVYINFKYHYIYVVINTYSFVYRMNNETQTILILEFIQPLSKLKENCN